jgi:hypothetical protein
MITKPARSKLKKSTRFVYVMHKNAKLQTLRNEGDWRTMHDKAHSALATWAQIYPTDELSLWATDKEWER